MRSQSRPYADGVSVLSAEDFRCRGVRGATSASRRRRWWCGPGTWFTIWTVSPAPRAVRCWPPGTTSAWRTVWSTAGCTLRLWSRENIRHTLTTQTWSRTKASARPTRSDYPTSTELGRCRRAAPGKEKAPDQEPSWQLITQVRKGEFILWQQNQEVQITFLARS